MKNRFSLSLCGITLIELLISVSMLSIVIGIAMTSWISFTQTTNRINSQVSLDMEARSIIENFRSELSKTSRDSIIFYPLNQAPYQAVSFALPSDQDGDGLIDVNPATSNILWCQTIVYHIFNQSTKPPQMRRTQFLNRYPAATFDARYAQVAKVVVNGDGAAPDVALTGETPSTKVMFENLFTGRLWHAEARFDGYAPTSNTLDRVDFGVAPIDSGVQQITFTVVDKHPLSNGWKIGLDRLIASASGWPLEAELIANATSIPKVYAGVGGSSAAYGLLTTTSANGQQMMLTLNNDTIEECLFIGADRNVLFSNTVVRLDTAYTPSGFGSGVLCSKLDGQCLNAWNATEQAMCSLSAVENWSLYTNFWAVIRIPILSDPVLNTAGEPYAYGVRKSGFNPVFRLMKSRNNGGIQINNAAFVIISPTDMPANSSMDPILGSSPEIIPLQCWQNGTVTTWSNALPRTSADVSQLVEFHSTANRAISIQTGSTLMLQLEVKVVDGVASPHYAKRLPMNRSSLHTGCWYKLCSSSSEVNALWQDPRWESANPSSSSHLPFLRSMVVNYVDEGSYISHVFDTTDIGNHPKTMTWEALMPSGGGGVFNMYARSGNSISANGFNIEDASAWESISPLANPPPTSGASVGSGRYVQFKTFYKSQISHLAPDTGTLTSSTSLGPYHNDTPRLRWVRFQWTGDKKYVNVAAELLKGPDCGIFTVQVNGKELVRGVTMEIEIFKDIRGVGGKTLRLISGISAEVDPRNSNK